MSSFSPINQESPEIQMSGVKMDLTSSFDSLHENKLDTIKVYCRVRPMLQREEDAGYTECIAAIDDQVVRALVPTSSMKFKNSSHNGQEITEDFKYTLAFGPEVGQFSFFQETILDIMQGFIEGQNGLIFSYGITNSGKTYTLQGDEANPGIIPLALHLFFACIEHQLLEEISVKPEKYSEIISLNRNEKVRERQLKEQLLQLTEHEPGNKSADSTAKSFGVTLCETFYDSFKFEDRHTTLPPEEMMAAQSALYMKEMGKKSADEQPGLCSVWVSFVEIYNEYIYDLLQPNILQRQKLNLAEDQNGEVYVKGAKEICVSSGEEAIKLLKLGRRNLRIASTKLNYQSSRSHCIYTLKVIRLYDEENSTCGRVNRLSFCDLAGSERAEKSQASGLRLKEACYINTSLLVLGRCLDQLRLNQSSREKKMIPYRESKLTRLFYSHFIGKGKATMIANASPCEQTFDETLNVLRFSALTKELSLNDAYTSMASTSIQKLNTQWGQTKVYSNADFSLDQSSDFNTSISYEIKEKDEIIEKLFKMADELNENLKKEKKEKAELEVAIRQDVCNELSEITDKMIENQRKISEQRIEAMKKNFQTRLNDMEKMYEDKIEELKSQLKEYESEESINESVDIGNETSISEVIQKTNSIPSPQVFDENNDDCEDIEECEKYECTYPQHEKIISENKRLKLDLTSLKNELETTTEQLQKYTVMIVDLQSEIKQYEENAILKTESMDVSNIKIEQAEGLAELKSLNEELQLVKEQLEQNYVLLKESQLRENAAEEECNVLKCKLEEANQVLEEYKKEFDEIKLDAMNKEREQLALLQEKQDLEENIISLSEKLGLALSDAECLKEAKLKIEDKLSQQSIEILKIKTESELKCEQVSFKLEGMKKDLEEKLSVISNLESECNNIKNENIKLVAENKALEEQLALMLKKADEAISEKQYNELLCKNNKLVEAFDKQQLKLEATVEALKEEELKFSKLESEYSVSKEIYAKLLEEHQSIVESFQNLKEEMGQTIPEKQYNELCFKNNELVEAFEKQQLKLEATVEAVKEQELKFSKLESEYTISKETYDKLSEDHQNVVESFQNLKEEMEKTVPASKYQELLDDFNSGIASSQSVKEKEIEMEIITKALNEEKSKSKELKLEYTALKNENAKLLEDHSFLKEKLNSSLKDQERNNSEQLNIELEAKLENSTKSLASRDSIIVELEAKCSELDFQLKNCTQTLNEQKTKFDALTAEHVSLEKENACLIERYSALEEDFIKINAQSDAVYNETKLKLEESTVVINSQKLEIEELLNKCNDFCTKFETTTDLLKDQKLKFEELSVEASAHKDEKIKMTEKYTDLETEFQSTKDALDAQIENYEQLKKEKNSLESVHAKSISELKACLECDEKKNQELTESLQASLECDEKKIQELTDTLKVSKDENIKLEQDLKNLQDEFKSQAEEKDAQNKKYEQLKKEKDSLESLHTKSISELQTSLECDKEKIRELKETLQACKDENIKLEHDLKNLQDEFKSQAEEKDKVDNLVTLLQKCELNLTNKIETLYASNSKNHEEILDLKRQVTEKEASIDQLERALNDVQNVKKENEAKLEKQIAVLKHQHSIEIEEVMHLKKISEQENVKLKSTLAQIDQQKETLDLKETKDKEKKSKSKPKTTKGDKKGMSAKEENDEFENIDVTKKRRPLRSKQIAENIEEIKNIAEIKEEDVSDNDAKPPRRTQKRKSDEEYKPPAKKATRTTRKKLTETEENMSPVQKAISYVGAKFRSVAQSVGNVQQSPRVTRGRKKLFNADAGPSAVPKWKL